jgi:hypothetical protein
MDPLAATAPPPPLPPPLPPPEWKNYFARHWHGELSLPLSYWVNGSVLGLVAGAGIAVLNIVIYRNGEARPLLWLCSLAATWLAICLLVGWQAVGIWRSATRYRQSGKRFWGATAKVMIAIGVLQTGFRFVSAGVPQIAGMYDIVIGDAKVGLHQFHVLANGRMLEFAGGITFGVAKEMESLLNAMEGVTIVRLNSIGGRIREAQQMSDLIKARGLSTYVIKDCLSACTIVFLGGKERLITQTARLGFHQPAFRGMTDLGRRLMISTEEERLEHFGLSRAFAERANKATPDSMWFPEKDELLREHIITRVIAPNPTPTPAPVEPKPPATASPRPALAPAAAEAKATPTGSDRPAGAGDASPPASGGDPARALIPPDVIKRLNVQKPPAARPAPNDAKPGAK